MVLVWRVGGCLQGSGVKSRRVFCMVLHGSAWFWCGSGHGSARFWCGE